MSRDLGWMITVDPGVGGTGIATWRPDSLQPSNTTVIVPSRKEWLDRVRDCTEKFSYYMSLVVEYGDGDLKQCSVWIEYPRLFENASSQASAERGDLLKLTFLVGCYASICWRYGLTFHPLPVNDWKGTMKKSAVAARVARILQCGKDSYGDHEMDAVGMGLYLKGVLNQTGLRRPLPDED